MRSDIQRPFVWLAWGSMLGTCLGAAFDSRFWVSIGLIMTFLIGIFCYMKWARGFYWLLLVSSCLLFLLRFSYVDGTNRSQLDHLVKEEELHVVQGNILSFPRMDGDRFYFDFALNQIQNEKNTYHLEEERIRVIVLLQQKGDRNHVKSLMRGDLIQAKIKFMRPQPARNPGGFDYKKFLYYQRIHWLGEVGSLHQIEPLQRSRWNFRNLIDQLRQQLADQIAQIYAPPYEGYIRGLILGEREQLDPQMEESYASFGIIHVLSISGLHISILVALCFYLLKGIGFSREKASLLVFSILPCYVLLTGAEPPVIRAGIMAGLLLIAVMLNQWKDSLSFLAIAFLLQLGWNPYLLFTASFQFTFIITAALIVGVPPLVDRISGSWQWLKQALTVALVAQFASFPIAIRFFYEFTFLSWIANLVFVPFISLLVLPGSMLAVAVSYINLAWGSLIASLTVTILKWIHYGMKWLYPLYFPVKTWQPPSLYWVFVYSGASLYLWFALIQERRNQTLHRFIAVSLFIGTLFWAYSPPDEWGIKTRVTFLDVGQGDCTLIETEQGRTILIDGGGTPFTERERWKVRRDPFEAGKDVVVPFLKYRGIDQIDTLIITHGDADHIGGLKAVISRFPVKNVIRNPLPPHSKLEKELMEQLNDQGTPIYTAPIGITLPIEDGVWWQFLHPSVEERLKNGESTNNDSVVILFSFYGHPLLMTGDIEKVAEDVLLKRWNLPPVEVLKVAHHGSKTSTQESWLQQINPKEAVISVGRKNRYGHPSQAVIQRIQKHQARIWRTDQHGAITIFFYPDRYTIESMISFEE